MKIISIMAAMAVAASFGIGASAADKTNGEPDVYVDGNKILFADQNAKIVDGRTLVPARGVFEAMGCKVEWNGDNRVVTVTSATGVQSVYITIDSDKMKVSKFKSIMEKTEDEVTLDVAAQIMNDRTMIPLRAVSEAFDCDVEWDDEDYKVIITTGDPILLDGYTYTAPDKDELVHMSLSTDKTGALEVGEEFTVYVSTAKIPADSICSGVTAAFEYDKNKLEYVSGSGMLVTDDDAELEADISNENTEVDYGTRVMFVKVLETTGRKTDGTVFKCKFRSLAGEKSEIALNNSYMPRIGYGSYLMFTEGDNDVVYSGNNMVLGAAITIGE